eukprot:3494564-Heterocapsa_arctica.AAC.1
MAKRSERKPCWKRSKSSHTKERSQTRPNNFTPWRKINLRTDQTRNPFTTVKEKIHRVWRRI